MDPLHRVNDIIRCDLCKEDMVQRSMYCDFCHVNLCKSCIGEHISDEYDKHKIVPFKTEDRKSNLMFPSCNLHSQNTCELQCRSCNVFICVICFASSEHKGHELCILEDIYKIKKQGIEKDTEEIEKVIVPSYEEIRNGLIDKIASLHDDYENIAKVMTEQGEKWHTEIDRVIIKMKNKLMEIKETNRTILEEHLNEIKQIESLIKRNLSVLKELEESNAVSVVVKYRSRAAEFGKLPAKVRVTLPTLCPRPINGEQVYEMFGSLTPFVSTTDENGYNMKFPEGWLLNIPEVINTFNTGYQHLRNISFYTGEEIWTSARVDDIKCFDTDGNCKKTITTKSGEVPTDIAVTNAGNLVYCFFTSKTIIIKKQDGKIEDLIKLQGWAPINLCHLY